jgi:Putative MetA-pathway of phenol degradation
MTSPLRMLLFVPALLLAGTFKVRAQCPSEVGDRAVAASPTRPVVTDGADVIQTGVVELESGWASGWPGGGVRQDAFGSLYKMGLFCNFEFRASTNAFQGQTNLTGSRVSGMGDVWYSGQYRVVTQNKAVPSISVIYGVKQPTASAIAGLGSGEMDHVVAVAVGKPFGKTFWSMETKWILSGRQGGSGFDQNSEISLNIARPIARRLGMIVEIYGDTQTNATKQGFASTLWAIQYSLNSRLILDAGIDIGLTTGAPHKRVFAGVSYAVGDLYRSLRYSPISSRP